MPEHEPTRGDQILMGRFTAGVGLLGATGARYFEIAYEDDDDPRWRCQVTWKGTKVWTKGTYPYPWGAVDEMLDLVVQGGTCTTCGKTVIVQLDTEDEAFCSRYLMAGDIDDPTTYYFIRSCDEGKCYAPTD